MYCIYKRVCWLLSKTVSEAQSNMFNYFSIFLGSSEDKVKAIQKKLALDDKLSSGERIKTEKR